MLLGWCLVYVASTYGVSLSHYLTFPVTLFAMTKTPGAMHVAKITTKRVDKSGQPREYVSHLLRRTCLLYTSDAADDLTRVDLGGRRIIKKKKNKTKHKKHK